MRVAKVLVAKEIIDKSKALGAYKPMSNGQFVTPELLAAANTMSELRKIEKLLNSLLVPDPEDEEGTELEPEEIEAEC